MCSQREKHYLRAGRERDETGLSQPPLTPKAEEEDGVRGKKEEWRRKRSEREDAREKRVSRVKIRLKFNREEKVQEVEENNGGVGGWRHYREGEDEWQGKRWRNNAVSSAERAPSTTGHS